MLLDKIRINGKIGNRIKEIHIKKFHYEEWIKINQFTEKYNFNKLVWSAKVYHYMFNILEIPKCKTCNKNNCNFIGRINKPVYTIYCSNKCSAISNNKDNKRQKTLEANNILRWGVKNVGQLEGVKSKIKETILKKYGVEHHFQLDSIKDKIKETTFKNYGVECNLQLPEIREKCKIKRIEDLNNPEWVEKCKSTWIQKYGGIGFASPLLKEKYAKFCMNKWGVTNSYRAEEIKDKIKQHYLNKYGVEYPGQVDAIYDKIIKSSFSCKKYKEGNVYYQGTYELDFLNRYYDKIEITRADSIKYSLNDSLKVYYPDFYLGEYDLIIEIKSSYYWNKHLEKNLAKYHHMINNKINYIVIIDKDYTLFEELINTLKD